MHPRCAIFRTHVGQEEGGKSPVHFTYTGTDVTEGEKRNQEANIDNRKDYVRVLLFLLKSREISNARRYSIRARCCSNIEETRPKAYSPDTTAAIKPSLSRANNGRLIFLANQRSSSNTCRRRYIRHSPPTDTRSCVNTTISKVC